MKGGFIKRTRIVRRPKPEAKTLAQYGPKERREWIKTLPCYACSLVGFSVNAHTVGVKGMSMKAGPETIAPLCDGPGSNWCHKKYDRRLPPFDKQKVRDRVIAYAVSVEAMWQQRQHASACTRCSNQTTED